MNERANEGNSGLHLTKTLKLSTKQFGMITLSIFWDFFPKAFRVKRGRLANWPVPPIGPIV
jgi:hypothetical protein